MTPDSPAIEVCDQKMNKSQFMPPGVCNVLGDEQANPQSEFIQESAGEPWELPEASLDWPQ